VVAIVVPFRAGGKTRLPEALREEAALAMLGDVLEAAAPVGPTHVVTADPAAAYVARELGADVVDDPGGGQGAAVAAALAGLDGAVLVVNADLPRARPSDLNALALPAQAGTLALVQARDGTTNALGLPSASAFAPLYGPGSAAQFRAHARALGLVHHDVALRNLEEDVDTLDDLEHVGRHAGPRTRALVAALHPR
jgi:2-phospho-L-lactate/phosphoenolpyruvate guanylyltransferase